MADLIQDDAADAVTTHPAAGGQPAQRNDKRGMLHMLHDEIGQALGIGRAKDTTVMSDGKAGGLMDAVDSAVAGARNANPDNP